ncbi:MAG: circularly permuted type 2 ATP-grasp protein [Gammaproteobacteria bacterium]|nr:circularly permuted type 2 ATP-grasp protein [Gammaproteobacteria bacterium]
MKRHSSQTSQPGLAGIHPQWADALADYGTGPPAYDELLREGEVRAHWLPLLRQPLKHARGAPRASDSSPNRRRDALPFIIAAEEWRSIEAGLEQRARLLNAINMDLYGAQRLLREQGFPPALVFANCRYLPACRPGFSASGAALGLFAFDLGRAPDGGWRVLANRTETPTGLGLALENRIHTASVLTVAAQEAAIASLNDVLGGFGAEVRQRGQATGTPRDSLCVLLAGDATQPDYADWIALSEHLGFPLLEGNDLAVRRGSVFAKTLTGLKPVAAVLRMVESDGCDPLTLSPTSLAGAPGLLNAATQRGVAVINPIGSGAVDSDALHPFLPALCEHLLDEPLLLPSLATWWCGQRQEAAQVLERLDQLAVGEAFGSPCGLDGDPTPTQPGSASSAALRTAIQTQPYRFAGREPLCPSTAPCLTSDGQLKPAPVTLRLFAAATPSGYRVLPGGLARTANGLNSIIKDVWIAETSLAHAPTTTADNQTLPGVSPVPLRRLVVSRGAAKPATANAAAGSAILTRRLGDDLFWFGRYLERAGASIRIFTALGHLIAEGHPPNQEAAQVLRKLLSTVGFAAADGDRSTGPLHEAGLCRLLFDAAGDDRLINLMERLRLTGMRRRGILPTAAWQAIEGIHQALQSRWRTRALADALRLLDDLALRLSAVSGLLDETQPRDQGFWLQRLGKHIERLRLLAAINIEFGVTAEPMDPNRLHWLLQLHHLAKPQAAWAADAGAAWHRLVCDADHPKSMRHQADRISLCLERLSAQGSSTGLNEVRNCASALIDELANACRVQEVTQDNETQRLLSSASARATEISALVSAMWLQPQNV